MIQGRKLNETYAVVSGHRRCYRHFFPFLSPAHRLEVGDALCLLVFLFFFFGPIFFTTWFHVSPRPSVQVLSQLFFPHGFSSRFVGTDQSLAPPGDDLLPAQIFLPANKVR